MMKKRKLFYQPSLTALVMLLICGSGAYAGNLPDTGAPNEHVCNPQSYTDLGNGIVRDTVTGIMWQQATAPGTYTWQQAKDYCTGLSLGGYTDWYLPPIKELSTLVDSSIAHPSPNINTTYFPDALASSYWSATTRASETGDAWFVNFSYGGATYATKAASSIPVRCMRDGS
jgi:hypothetical protein